MLYINEYNTKLTDIQNTLMKEIDNKDNIINELKNKLNDLKNQSEQLHANNQNLKIEF